MLGLPEPTPEQLLQMAGPPLQDGFALVLAAGAAVVVATPGEIPAALTRV